MEGPIVLIISHTRAVPLVDDVVPFEELVDITTATEDAPVVEKVACDPYFVGVLVVR